MTREKKQRRFRVNVFDVVVILLALALAAGIYFIRGAGQKNASLVSSGTTTTLYYTIELVGLYSPTADLISEGDTLVDKIEKHTLGNVVSKEISEYKTQTKNQNTGEYIMSAVPGRQTAVIVVKATATETEREFNVNGFVVRVGTQISVTGPGYSGFGYITSIDRDGKLQ